MTVHLMTPEIRSRKLDVTSIENALVDMLVRGTENDLKTLQLVKGTMKLVDTLEQERVLGQVGSLKPEVEVGGSAANVLRALAILGGSASYSSVVGEDAYGKAFADRLKHLSIKSRLVFEKGQTGTCVVVVTEDGERTLNTHLGVCTSYHFRHVPKDDIADSKIFFTTGYAWDTQNQKDAIRHAIAHATESGSLVALDVADAFVVERSGAEIRAVLEESVDIAFANSKESAILTGATGAEGARRLGEWVRLAIVKDGADGSCISYQGDLIHVPAPAVKVTDTTGAGDFYAGGFLFGLCRGLPIEVCGAIATCLGSDTVTHLGVRHSHDIVERVRSIVQKYGYPGSLIGNA
jgi:sugar/nucleoside kinase (ribokinase family)